MKRSIPTDELLDAADLAMQRARRADAASRLILELDRVRSELESEGAAGWQGRLRVRRLQRLIDRVEGRRRGLLADWLRPLAYGVLIALLVRIFLFEAFQIPTGSMERSLLVGDYLLVNKLVYGPKTPSRLVFYRSSFTPRGWSVGREAGESPLFDIHFPSIRLPGLRSPRPGDIIVFANPADPSTNYIKRCVAVAGQTVELRDKRVFVDGEELPEPYVHLDADYHTRPVGRHDPNPLARRDMDHAWGHLMRDGAWNRDQFGPVQVPPGALFMMGDNRDQSLDSRYWGFLDEDLIRGKASLIYFSRDRQQPPWKLFAGVRWARVGRAIR